MRLLHRLYAFAFGYFWLPCPRCDRFFGGHEKGGGTMLPKYMHKLADGSELPWIPSSGFTTCPKCPGQFWDDGSEVSKTQTYWYPEGW